MKLVWNDADGSFVASADTTLPSDALLWNDASTSLSGSTGAGDGPPLHIADTSTMGAFLFPQSDNPAHFWNANDGWFTPYLSSVSVGAESTPWPVNDSLLWTPPQPLTPVTAPASPDMSANDQPHGGVGLLTGVPQAASPGAADSITVHMADPRNAGVASPSQDIIFGGGPASAPQGIVFGSDPAMLNR